MANESENSIKIASFLYPPAPLKWDIHHLDSVVVAVGRPGVTSVSAPGPAVCGLGEASSNRFVMSLTERRSAPQATPSHQQPTKQPALDPKTSHDREHCANTSSLYLVPLST